MARSTAPTQETSAEETAGKRTSLRKTRVGIVKSDKMAKTIAVEVTRRVPHPRFRKIVKRSSKFYAHDENSEAKVGDKVSIMECRPLSKSKRWRLLEVLSH